MYLKQDACLLAVPNGFRGVSRIPEWVSDVGVRAFNGNSKVTDVFLPSKVTSIQEQAFGNCSDLQSLRFEGNAPLLGENGFNGTCSTAIVTVPKEAQGFGTIFHGLPVLVTPRILDIKLTPSGNFVITLDECFEGWGIGFQDETNSELVHLHDAHSVTELEWSIDASSPQLQSKHGFFKMLYLGQEPIDNSDGEHSKAP